MSDYTIDGAVTAVVNAFLTSWGATTPVNVENELGFTLPAPTIPPAAAATWARIVVRHLNSEQETLGVPGARKWERTAMVAVQLFIQAGAGVETLYVLAEQARQVYEGVDLAGIILFKSDVFELGPDGKGWHQINVSTRFRYYQTH